MKDMRLPSKEVFGLPVTFDIPSSAGISIISMISICIFSIIIIMIIISFSSSGSSSMIFLIISSSITMISIISVSNNRSILSIIVLLGVKTGDKILLKWAGEDVANKCIHVMFINK